MFGLAILQDTWEGGMVNSKSFDYDVIVHGFKKPQETFKKHHFNPDIGPYGAWTYKPQPSPLSAWESEWFEDWYGKYEELGAIGK